MDYLSIEDIKRHLNVDFNDDDTYITSLMKAAQSAVETYLNAPLKDFADENNNLCPDILHAMRLLVGNWYANREPVAFASASLVPYTIDFLLKPHKRFISSVEEVKP